MLEFLNISLFGFTLFVVLLLCTIITFVVGNLMSNSRTVSSRNPRKSRAIRTILRGFSLILFTVSLYVLWNNNYYELSINDVKKEIDPEYLFWIMFLAGFVLTIVGLVKNKIANKNLAN